ncbi:MAG: nucleoside-diphosphate sugar epimerase/dehydratase, partial [Mycobacterium sp.]
CVTRVMVVGSASAVRDLTTSFAREPKSEYQVIGACVSGPIKQKKLVIPGLEAIPILGDESNVIEALAATNSHAVAVTAT